jgi:NADH-quinone oxidoreductase subunit F
MDGNGKPEDIDLLFGVQGKIMGNTICALGDAAAMPVESFLRCMQVVALAHLQHRPNTYDNLLLLIISCDSKILAH